MSLAPASEHSQDAREWVLSRKLIEALEAIEELRNVRKQYAPNIPTVPAYLRDRTRLAILEVQWWAEYEGNKDA